jgi:hypothetical protein
MKVLLIAIWQFCSYLFWPQWNREHYEDTDAQDAGSD